MKSVQQVIRRYLSGLSIVILLLVIILTNLGISWIFNNYLAHNKEAENNEYAKSVVDALEDNTLDMSEEIFLRQMANHSGVHLLLLSGDDETLFDSTITGNGTKRQLLSKRKEVLNTENLSYTNINIEAKSKELYELKIGREKGWLISDADIYFIIGINIIFVIVLIIAATTVWLLSKYLSKKFSTPIIEIQKATDIIKNGNYKNVSLRKSDTKELNELGEAVKSLALQLDNQEQLRKRMTTDIAHELRSPMAVVRSQVEGMIDGVMEPTDERLGRINGEIMRLTKLIDDLNELSIIENDLYELKKERFNLTELVVDISEGFKAICKTKELDMLVDVEPGIEMIGDRKRIGQVMNNLLSNAYKYTDNGSIMVQLKENDEAIELRVEDTGIGISDKDLPYVFERFYRADPSRNRNTGGAGIGLAIVKKIVESHGGKISVESTIGTGTIFIIEIPNLKF